MIQAIIFDCFGVLATSFSQALYDEFPDKTIELHDLFAEADFGRLSETDILNRLEEITGWPHDQTIEFFDRAQRGVVRNERLVELISELRKSYKIGVLSNVARGMFGRFFDDRAQTKLFDAVVLSSDYGIVKPDGRIYEIAAKKLNIAPSECLFVDDRQENCEGARAVGMRAIRYENISQFRRSLVEVL